MIVITANEHDILIPRNDEEAKHTTERFDRLNIPYKVEFF